MALSTELLKRLNSDEEPLPKRFKLAENVFCTVDLPVIRKENLILEWLCKTCSTDENGWRHMKNCLKTNHLDIKVDVKRLLVNTLVTRLQGTVEDLHSDIFDCYKLLLWNNEMQQYFINDPNDLGLLVKSLLSCALKFFKYTFNIEEATIGIDVDLIHKNDGLPLTIYNTIISVIEIILLISKFSFTTNDKLRIIFVGDILYPLCNIIDQKCTDNRNRLGVATYKCVQQLIFGRKYAETGVLPKNKDTTQFMDLISVLVETSRSKDLRSNICTFSFIFRAAVGIFKSDGATLDLILRELVECMVIHKREIFSALLKHLDDVIFNFDNKIHDVTLVNYCQIMIDDILSSENMSTVDYILISQFCSFNPLLIERKIQEILGKAFQGNPTLEYTNLMVSIMNAVVHLRQEEKLIPSIMIALKSKNLRSNTKFETFFPYEFKKVFMKSVSNITNSQSVCILRTLVYHLKTDCMELLQSNDTCKTVVVMQAIVDLLVTFLNGVCIFEHTGTLTFHTKFINAIDDLGNILSLLIDRILHLNYNKEIIVTLLRAIFSWNKARNTLKYYIPKGVTKDLSFPILEDQWQQLIQRITNFGEDNCKDIMNKLILQQTKMSQNMSDKSYVKLNNLVGGLKYSWKPILQFDTNVISLLTTKQISKVTDLLLAEVASSEDNFSKWVEVLRKDDLQENKRLSMCLLNSVIIQMETSLTTGVTKSMCQYFARVNTIFLEDQNIDNQEVNEIVVRMKEDLLRDEWIEIKSTLLQEIKVYLKLLLHVPLMFLNANVRSLTFMIFFALRKESHQNDDIISLCDVMLSDLLEKPGIDIFQYIGPVSLCQLPLTRNVQKTLELSLRNGLSYTVFKELINASENSKKTLHFLLESVEHVKQKLNVDQRVIVRKVERKLSKILIKSLPSTITEIEDINILSSILKIYVSNENITEELKDLVQRTLQSIFLNDNIASEKNEIIQETLKLAVVVLRNKKMFQIEDQTIKEIWRILFRYPCVDVLFPLLESCESLELEQFLKDLHDQMVKAITHVERNDLENVCTMWNSILKINMSNDRNRLRLTAINKSIQTIQVLNVPNQLWPMLLKLIHDLLATKHLYLPDTIIDSSIFLSLKSLQETTILTCNDALTVCNVLLKMKTSSITDRLPALLALYRRILNVVVCKSKDKIDKSEEHTLKCIALDIEKFTSSLIKLKKDMARLSPYLIADLLKLFSESSIATAVKTSLQNCIYSLISICDRHGIALLFRTLPISMQEILKTQLDMFNKFYKFSGKI
ncbi:uncharacterized protein LOC143214678 [Lasioglossum baleicum]|uniref:uncharacterized protein LOC143214678 n=1 Tax=Lasioglossum baleicum TaxID=434251 RepID=UPI003FCCF277